MPAHGCHALGTHTEPDLAHWLHLAVGCLAVVHKQQRLLVGVAVQGQVLHAGRLEGGTPTLSVRLQHVSRQRLPESLQGSTLQV